jgi:predicted DNA-binding protein
MGVLWCFFVNESCANFNMKKQTFTAIQCRVPDEIYADAKKLTAITDKSIASMVANSIEYYIGTVTDKLTEKQKTTLKLDKYAYSLKK